MSKAALILAILMLLAPAIAAKSTADAQTFNGNVSWYGTQFHGKKTASGELFDMNKCTSAHRRLPFKTRVLVEDPRTGNAVIVKVNDRGPFCHSRVMDVSKAAAKKLALIGRGVAYMECTVIKPGETVELKSEVH